MNDALGPIDGAGNVLTDVVEFLEGTGTFERLPQSVHQILANALVPRRFAAGEALMEQGADGDCMLVIRTGNAQVSHQDDAGITRVLAQVGPGEVLGEMALLTAEPRSATVLAVSECDTLVLTAEEFYRVVIQSPDIAVVLTHLVADRLGHVERDGLRDKVLGGYRIRRRLGVGATAVVYRAVHAVTEEPVALKMLSHRLSFDETAIARFHRELDIVETLRHQNVATVHGRFDGFATFFMVMEFCDGQNLAELLAGDGALPPEEVRAIVGQIASALHHVHAHEVIHKDMKPANVMVNRDGVVKLMDFGIALPPREMRDDADAGTDVIAGTPKYMAPEQFRAIDETTAVDVYALGCIAYELLVGLPPFNGSTLGELVRTKLTSDYDPLERVCDGVPDDLASFVTACLESDPSKRPIDLSRYEAWARPIDTEIVARAIAAN